MNKFDLFAQDLQKKLNKTNFRISNFCFLLGFIFLFLLVYSTLNEAEIITKGAYIHIFIVAGLTIFLIRKNNKLEKIFLKTNKNPINPASGIKKMNFILCIFGLFFGFLFFVASEESVFLLIPCIFISIFMGMSFLFSTPIKPKEK